MAMYQIYKVLNFNCPSSETKGPSLLELLQYLVKCCNDYANSGFLTLYICGRKTLKCCLTYSTVGPTVAIDVCLNKLTLTTSAVVMFPAVNYHGHTIFNFFMPVCHFHVDINFDITSGNVYIFLCVPLGKYFQMTSMLVVCHFNHDLVTIAHR